MAQWSQLIEIVLLSYYIAGVSTLIGSMIGLPIGAFLGTKRFKGKFAIKTLIFTFYGFPPVVMGLIVFLLLSSSGPMGFLDFLYTPWAMIVAETFLATPLIIGITMTSVGSIDHNVKDLVRSLGVSKARALFLYLKEARSGIATAVMIGFGSCISEVGAAMMVGGNIEGHTRVMTTAIVLETRMGNFQTAMFLGAILLATTCIIYLAFVLLEGKRDD